MKKNIIGVAVALIIALIATTFVIRTFFSSRNSLSYRIFYAKEKGYVMYKILGILPASYHDRFSKTVLDSFDNWALINLVDDISSTHPNFIVLQRDAGSRFLKAYPFALVGVKTETVGRSGWEKHVSLLINIEVFNDYVHLKQLRSKEEITKAYFSFLSNPVDQMMHKILQNTSDIDSLIADWPIENLELINTGFNLIDAKSIDFEQPEGTVFCWLRNNGVVKFKFKFNDDNTFNSVNSDIIGFLGNEVPMI